MPKKKLQKLTKITPTPTFDLGNKLNSDFFNSSQFKSSINYHLYSLIKRPSSHKNDWRNDIVQIESPLQAPILSLVQVSTQMYVLVVVIRDFKWY